MVQKITWHWKQDDPLNHAMNYLLTTYFHLRLMSIPGRPTVHVTFHAFHPEKWFPNHTLAHLPCDLQELDNVAVSAAIWSIWIYPSVNMNVPHCPTWTIHQWRAWAAWVKPCYLSPGLFAPLAQICWDVKKIKKISHVETSNEVGNLEWCTKVAKTMWEHREGQVYQIPKRRNSVPRETPTRGPCHHATPKKTRKTTSLCSPHLLSYNGCKWWVMWRVWIPCNSS